MAETTTIAVTGQHDIQAMPGEIWKDIYGFDGLYMVSNMGRVASLYREIVVCGRTKRIFPRILKPSNYKGYKIVYLRKDGRTHNRTVHSLVAIAFLGPKKVGLEVNHKNGIRDDNRAENLEWCNRSYNIWHAYNVTKREQYSCVHVTCVENGVTYPSFRAAARELGLSDTLVSKVANGISKQTKGYHFVKSLNH